MNVKKILAIMSGVVLVAVFCGCVAFGSSYSEEIALKENQRYVYAYITSIQGNEVSYMEVEESVVLELLETEEETEEKEKSTEENSEKNAEENADAAENNAMSERPDRGNMSNDGEAPDMGNMPNSGEMPDMGNMPNSGEMPDMGNMPNSGEMPDMSSMSGERREESREDGMSFNGMSEVVTTYIPVGITVHTAADVSTTFSRLASGDLIKILVETNEDDVEIIEEIWMLQ